MIFAYFFGLALFIMTCVSHRHDNYEKMKQSTDCEHMKEHRFNQNLPIENQIFREVLKNYEEMH
jgi:hypothetical protein